LHFSNLSTETPNLLLLQVLNLSPDLVGPLAMSETTSYVSTDDFLIGRDGDKLQILKFLTSISSEKLPVISIVDLGGIGKSTLAQFVNRLVRAGRDTQAVSFFDKMETEYGLVRNRQSLNIVVSNLCENGFANSAEKMVKNLVHEFFPDESTCEMLIKGWCVDGKLDQAKRLAGEIHRGGFQLGTSAYNSILDCVCKLCRKKDNFRLQSEAEMILVEMDYA
ncbi:hypothetical protein MKX03_018601, partial [Papaver bracteatum]